MSELNMKLNGSSDLGVNSIRNVGSQSWYAIALVFNGGIGTSKQQGSISAYLIA